MTILKRIGASLAKLFKYLFLPRGQMPTRSLYEEEALLSPGRIIFKNFIKNRLAIIGIIGIMGIFLFSFGLSAIIPINTFYTNTFHRNLPPNYSYLSVPSALRREGIAKIDSSNGGNVGLSNDGNVFVWGANYRETLAIPDAAKAARIVDVSAGSQHYMAVADTGEIFFWGYNHQQQAQIHERFVDTFQTNPIVTIQGGMERTLAITEDGSIYVWGVGANNLGEVMNRSPYRFFDESGAQIKAVQMDSNFNNILVRLEDGTIRMIGVRSEVFSTLPAELQDGSVDVVDIGLTTYNAFAVSSNGTLYGWGEASFGMIGDSIPPAARSNVQRILTGYEHAVVLTNDGQVISWGDNQLNQSSVPDFNGSVDQLFVGAFQNFIVTDDGSIETWGLRGFLMGSDEQGRDFIVQLIHGGRITLTVGAVAVLISSIIGVTVGLTAGYFGGVVDNVLMRFAEIVSSFPFLPLAITLSALLLGGATTEVQRMLIIMVILGVLSWPGLARLIRGQVLSERERDYVMAANALGIKKFNIIVRHVFPAVISIVIVSMTLGYAGSLLTEAGLSFLGFGVQKPSPSWGNILTAAQDVNVIRTFWWRWVLPGLALIIAALSVNLIGDALRDAMDPKNVER